MNIMLCLFPHNLKFQSSTIKIPFSDFVEHLLIVNINVYPVRIFLRYYVSWRCVSQALRLAATILNAALHLCYFTASLQVS